MKLHAVQLDFPGEDSSPEVVSHLLAERVVGEKIHPQFVLPDELPSREEYVRFQELEEKAAYRQELYKTLYQAWEEEYGPAEADKLMATYHDCAKQVKEDGAVVFGDLIDRERFAHLVTDYRGVMDEHGSKCLLHSYGHIY